MLKNVHVFMFLYSEALCAFFSRDLHYKIFRWWRGTLCEEYQPQEKRAGKLQVQVGYASKAGFTLRSHRANLWLFCGHSLKRLRTSSLHHSTIQSWSWTTGLFTFHPFTLLLICSLSLLGMCCKWHFSKFDKWLGCLDQVTASRLRHIFRNQI